MKVRLPEDLQGFVEKQLSSGRYAFGARQE